YASVLSSLNEVGMRSHMVRVTLDMMRCYATLGRHDAALDVGSWMTQLSQPSDNMTIEVALQLAHARALAALGRVDEALSEVVALTDLHAAAGHVELLGDCHLLRAQLHLGAGHCMAAIDAAEAALAAAAEVGTPIMRGQTELVMARAFVELGQLDG